MHDLICCSHARKKNIMCSLVALNSNDWWMDVMQFTSENLIVVRRFSIVSGHYFDSWFFIHLNVMVLPNVQTIKKKNICVAAFRTNYVVKMFENVSLGLFIPLNENINFNECTHALYV